MFKKVNSIIFKVTLLFIFSLICFVAFVIYFITLEISQEDSIIEQRYNTIIYSIDDTIHNGGDLDIVKTYLNNIGFFEVKNKDIMEENTQKYFLIHGITSILTVNIKKINKHYYIVLYDTINGKNFAYTDYKEPSYTNYYYIAVIGLITIVFFYIIVLNSLLPLILLRQEVEKFSNGDMNIKTISDNGDEISKLSEEFTKAANKLNEVNQARILFLRSIMHELKTPITKGRIVVEMIENNKVKARLDSVFTRLNDIINDLARLEEITTKNYKIDKSNFRIIDLMQNINKMLIIDGDRPKNVILEDREARISADFYLMSLSVKNLVDNATKHASNHRVSIFVENNDLVVKNKGEPFKHDLEQYFKPFYNDGSKNDKRGLGLGMYIIKNTLEAQGFKLEYKYEDNHHLFYIKDCIIST